MSETATAKNPVVHFEVLGRDAGALRTFYSEAFGWPVETPDDGPMAYAMVRPEGNGGINGGIGRAPEGPGHATFYVGVDDLDAALRRVGELGGKTVQPPVQIPGGVAFAYFADPEGHVVGLLRG
jgi:predicted enzyme related to lactoylglutathione lyase